MKWLIILGSLLVLSLEASANTTDCSNTNFSDFESCFVSRHIELKDVFKETINKNCSTTNNTADTACCMVFNIRNIKDPKIRGDQKLMDAITNVTSPLNNMTLEAIMKDKSVCSEAIKRLFCYIVLDGIHRGWMGHPVCERVKNYAHHCCFANKTKKDKKHSGRNSGDQNNGKNGSPQNAKSKNSGPDPHPNNNNQKSGSTNGKGHPQNSTTGKLSGNPKVAGSNKSATGTKVAPKTNAKPKAANKPKS